MMQRVSDMSVTCWGSAGGVAGSRCRWRASRRLIHETNNVQLRPQQHNVVLCRDGCAGAAHGQELPPERMEALIRGAGREPWQRTTLYAAADAEQTAKSFGAAALAQLAMR